MKAHTLKFLREETGGLSNPSKMPGYAWGISPDRCMVGGKLQKVSRSVCSTCYAMKGNYRFENVKKAHERRYQKWLTNPMWESRMTELITRTAEWFRWFDAGDVQSVGMIEDIAKVAFRSPTVNHWVSTRERSIIKEWGAWAQHTRPHNMVIRVSDPMIGVQVPSHDFLMSGVEPKAEKKNWKSYVEFNGKSSTWYCPAPLQNNECGDCRACWDPKIPRIQYLEH